MNPVPTERVVLGSSDVAVTRFVLGCAPIGGMFSGMREEQATRVLESAWTAGIRAFDTAPHYGVGLSEERLGRFLARRSDLEVVVSSKVGRLLVPTSDNVQGDHEFFTTPQRRRVRDFTRDGVRRSVEETCLRIGRTYLDIALIHDPEGDERQALDEAYPALVELRAEGTVKAIGVGTKDHAVAAWLVEQAELDCVLIAGAYSLLGVPAAEELFPACKARGTSVLVAGVFKSGILADPSPDAHLDYGPVTADVLARARQMAVVCERHEVPLAAVALHFAAANPTVDAIVVGAASAGEVQSNVAALADAAPLAVFQELDEHGLLPVDGRTACP